MTDLSFTPGDATWQAMRARALRDLYYFAGVVLRYGDGVGMTDGMHRLMCRFVEKRTGIPALDQAPYRLVLMPRGTGKSTLITQGYVLQRLCADANLSVLIANERLDNATAFLGAIKQQIAQNDLLQALFPEIVPPDYNKTTWSDTEIVLPRTTTRKEASILCIGSGGTVTGMHPDLIVADDIISREAMENQRRGDGNLTEQAVRWLAQLVPLLNSGYEPFPEILMPGTRWFRGDIYERAEELWGYGMPRQTWMLAVETPLGRTEPVAVHRAGDVAIFSRKAIEHGRPTWPERKGYDIESLAKIRLMDPALYAANFQNDPSDDLTAAFKEAWIQYYDWTVPDQQVQFVDATGKTQSHRMADLDILLLIDPGGFAMRKGNDRMRGAVLVTGTTPGDTPEHLVLDAYSDQVPFMQVAEQILAMTTRYHPRKVYIEEVAQQAAFLELVRRLAAERGILLPLERITPKSKVKEARILNLEPYFQRGLVRFGKGPQFHELREQYRSFPGGHRIDLLDALAYGPQVWRQPRMGAAHQQARQHRELDAYRKRLGLTPTRNR